MAPKGKRIAVVAGVVVVVVVVLAVFNWLRPSRHSTCPLEMRCVANLGEIHKAFFLLAQRKRPFPGRDKTLVEHDLKNSLKWINTQLAYLSLEPIDPETFVCPASDQHPADPDADGHFVLTEDTCSYEFPLKRLVSDSNSPGSRILAFDRCPCHYGSRLVLDSWGRILRVEEEQFQEWLAARSKEPEPK